MTDTGAKTKTGGIALLTCERDTNAERAIQAGRTHPTPDVVDVPSNQKWSFATTGATPSAATIELCLLRDIRDNAQYQSLADRSERRQEANAIIRALDAANKNISIFSENVQLMYHQQAETNRLLRKIAGEDKPPAADMTTKRKPAKKRKR